MTLLKLIFLVEFCWNCIIFEIVLTATDLTHLVDKIAFFPHFLFDKKTRWNVIIFMPFNGSFFPKLPSNSIFI